MSAINVRTHPDAAKEERETNITIPSDGDRAHIYSEQPGMMRRLLRNPHADVYRLTVIDGEVVCLFCYLPIGAVKLNAMPRKTDRVSKVHGSTGLVDAEETFRGGLDDAIRTESSPDVHVPMDVREARNEGAREGHFG